MKGLKNEQATVVEKEKWDQYKWFWMDLLFDLKNKSEKIRDKQLRFASLKEAVDLINSKLTEIYSTEKELIQPGDENVKHAG